jgi:hypothetical protein
VLGVITVDNREDRPASDRVETILPRDSGSMEFDEKRGIQLLPLPEAHAELPWILDPVQVSAQDAVQDTVQDTVQGEQ